MSFRRRINLFEAISLSIRKDPSLSFEMTCLFFVQPDVGGTTNLRYLLLHPAVFQRNGAVKHQLFIG